MSNSTSTPYRALMGTYSGRMVDVVNLQSKDIFLLDMGVAICNLCRFGGHLEDFYSVGEHSILVGNYAAERFAKNDRERLIFKKLGYLHDGSEGFCVDVPRGLKHHPDMHFYVSTEERAQDVIMESFGLLDEWREYHDIIKKADNWACGCEAISFKGVPYTDWPSKYIESEDLVRILPPPMQPKEARAHYFAACRQVGLNAGR